MNWHIFIVVLAIVGVIALAASYSAYSPLRSSDTYEPYEERDTNDADPDAREESPGRDEKPSFEGLIEDAESIGGERSSESATGVSIDLSNRGLTDVPQSIFNQTSADSLDLSHNKLSGALPAEIRHMSNLISLDLSDNNFTGVPAEIGQLTELETLDLSNNPITGLPYELANLSNLHILDLRGTNYSEYDLNIIKEGLPDDVRIRTD